MADRQPLYTCFIGPGHARHAAAAGSTRDLETLCGADKRRYSDGTLPGTNHREPFRTEDVTCRRCLKILGNGR